MIRHQIAVGPADNKRGADADGRHSGPCPEELFAFHNVAHTRKRCYGAGNGDGEKCEVQVADNAVHHAAPQHHHNAQPFLEQQREDHADHAGRITVDFADGAGDAHQNQNVGYDDGQVDRNDQQQDVAPTEDEPAEVLHAGIDENET